MHPKHQDTSTEQDSPRSWLPHVFYVELHDLDATPYAIRFALTRALNLGWTASYDFLQPVMRFIAGKDAADKKNTTYRPSDGVALLELETFGKMIEQQKKQQEEESSNNDSNKKNKRRQTLRVLDACSGSGGPSVEAAKTIFATLVGRECLLASSLNEDLKIHLTLSDLVPHPDHWKLAATQQVHSSALENTKKEITNASSSSSSSEQKTTRQIELLVDYEEQSTDVTKIPSSLFKPNTNKKKQRQQKKEQDEEDNEVDEEELSLLTVHGSFHHLPAEGLGLDLLKKNVENDALDGILIVELSEHHIVSAVILTIFTVALSLLTPWTCRELLFSMELKKIWLYIQCVLFMPILVFVHAHDAIVSCMRTRTSQEFLEMAKRADPDGKFNWHSKARPLVPPNWITRAFLRVPAMCYLQGVRRKQK